MGVETLKKSGLADHVSSICTFLTTFYVHILCAPDLVHDYVFA